MLHIYGTKIYRKQQILKSKITEKRAPDDYMDSEGTLHNTSNIPPD